MKRSRFILTVMAALAVSVGGCGDSTSPDITTGTIVVKNRSTQVIEFVQITHCNSGTWGDDRLLPSEVVAEDQDRTFLVEPGCWDLRVQTNDLRTSEKLANQVADHQTFVWTVTPF